VRVERLVLSTAAFGTDVGDTLRPGIYPFATFASATVFCMGWPRCDEIWRVDVTRKTATLECHVAGSAETRDDLVALIYEPLVHALIQVTQHTVAARDLDTGQCVPLAGRHHPDDDMFVGPGVDGTDDVIRFQCARAAYRDAPPVSHPNESLRWALAAAFERTCTWPNALTALVETYTHPLRSSLLICDHDVLRRVVITWP
jgi:hypothetical protein